MRISIVRFRTPAPELDKDFRNWFSPSSDQLRRSAGLKGRHLLRAPGRFHTAVMGHESASTVAAAHAADVVSMIQSGVGQILNECPPAMTYEGVVDFAAPRGRCAEGQGINSHDKAAETHLSTRCRGAAGRR